MYRLFVFGGSVCVCVCEDGEYRRVYRIKNSNEPAAVFSKQDLCAWLLFFFSIRCVYGASVASAAEDAEW